MGSYRTWTNLKKAADFQVDFPVNSFGDASNYPPAGLRTGMKLANSKVDLEAHHR